MRINFIGAGRLGQTLGHLLTRQGHQIGAVLTRSSQRAQAAVRFMGGGHAVTDVAQMQDADLWWIATPDRDISTCAELLAVQKHLKPSLVTHGSGALSSDVLQSLQERGWQTASAHCLMSFAQPALAVQQFKGVVCAVEGPGAPQLSALMTSLQAQCFQIDPQHKLTYHTAAVWATNFLPVLQNTAEQLWHQSGMPQELIVKLRAQLLQQVVNNIVTLGPQAALTGPASRGDHALVQAQAQALEALNSTQAQAYRALSALAGELSRGPADKTASSKAV